MIRPAPLWTMLAAVWALVLLGGAPLPAREELCGPGPARHHDAGCILCCPCAVAGAMQAIPAPGAALPAPRDGSLASGAEPYPSIRMAQQAVPVRARDPPGVA